MKRLIIGIICIFFLSGIVNAASISVLPETWFEINSKSGTTLIVEPETMEVGISNYQAKAFWEYDISQVINNFISIESALIEINNIGRTHTIQLFTYQADAIPTTVKWSQWNESDTWQNGVLYGWDDPFNRGPLNIFDITEGTTIAFNDGYDYLGAFLLAPSPSGVPNTFSEVEWDAKIVITGTPVDIVSSFWLLCSGLIGLVGLRKRFKK
jgi:hypothetical protein